MTSSFKWHLVDVVATVFNSSLPGNWFQCHTLDTNSLPPVGAALIERFLKTNIEKRDEALGNECVGRGGVHNHHKIMKFRQIYILSGSITPSIIRETRIWTFGIHVMRRFHWETCIRPDRDYINRFERTQQSNLPQSSQTLRMITFTISSGTTYIPSAESLPSWIVSDSICDEMFRPAWVCFGFRWRRLCFFNAIATSGLCIFDENILIGLAGGGETWGSALSTNIAMVPKNCRFVYPQL